MQVYSVSEVSRHNKKGDLWIIIDSHIYDLSKFTDFHPGGPTVLLDEEIAGQNATEAFYSLHRQEVLKEPRYARLKIGSVSRKVEENENDEASSKISRVPYAEPSWLVGQPSPYFKEHHFRFQAAFRKFIREVVVPDARAREEDGKPPSRHVLQEMARLNLLAMRLGPGKWLEGKELMDGVISANELDPFIEMIMVMESSYLHSRGYSDGLAGGAIIGLPPIINFGSANLKARTVKPILNAEKSVCLAITEAFAGSDIVSGIRTTARKVEGGWRVTGTKKWITNGMWADYFVTACRTEGGAITAIVVERGPGVDTRPIRTSYSSAAGTAFIVFDDVFVPDENLLGKEGQGLYILLSNFNHERWVLACETIGVQRAIVEECFKWSTQRKVFSKSLSSQPVIRAKLANMVARVESSQSWLENLTYQMSVLEYKQQADQLAGPIALLKMHATRDAQKTAADAAQVFGGRSFTRTGMGKHVEHFHRTLLIDAIGGGAEDILADLGIRQALRKMPRDARL